MCFNKDITSAVSLMHFLVIRNKRKGEGWLPNVLFRGQVQICTKLSNVMCVQLLAYTHLSGVVSVRGQEQQLLPVFRVLLRCVHTTSGRHHVLIGRRKLTRLTQHYHSRLGSWGRRWVEVTAARGHCNITYHTLQ